MSTFNIQEAKAQLSRLVDAAAKGESVIITKAGKPIVQVVPFDASAIAPSKRRLGFLAGQIAVPDDFDKMGSAEILASFFGAK